MVKMVAKRGNVHFGGTRANQSFLKKSAFDGTTCLEAGVRSQDSVIAKFAKKQLCLACYYFEDAISHNSWNLESLPSIVCLN